MDPFEVELMRIDIQSRQTLHQAESFFSKIALKFRHCGLSEDFITHKLILEHSAMMIIIFFHPLDFTDAKSIALSRGVVKIADHSRLRKCRLIFDHYEAPNMK